MNIERVDLNLLKVFVVIYEERKLTAAAARMGLTQPGLSHALNRLRDMLDDEVFVRVPRGVEPTRRAHDLYASVHESMSGLGKALLGPGGFDPEQAVRTFVIAANDYGATVVVPRLIKRMERVAPGVRIRTVHFEHGTQYDALQRGEIDLSITVRMAHPPWVSEDTLFHERAIGVVCARSRFLERKVTLRRYAEARHVVMAPSGTTTWMDDYLATHGLYRHAAHTVPHFHAMPPAIVGTDCIAIMPLQLIDPVARAWGLRLFDLPADVPSHPILQIWHGRWSNDAAHTWLRQQMRSATADLTDPDGSRITGVK